MRLPFVLLTALCAVCISTFTALTAAEDPMTSPVLKTTMNDINGKPYEFSQNRGKVMMLVNVASHCGHTPQYAGLESLYNKYKDQGLVIIGIPANNFGAQEPGTDSEIQAFCTSKYQVTFPMLAKVSVKGDDICPLYQYLTTQSPNPGPIGWNFAKFLIGRNGQVVDRFDPGMNPDDPKLVSSLEAALAAPANK